MWPTEIGRRHGHKHKRRLASQLSIQMTAVKRRRDLTRFEERSSDLNLLAARLIHLTIWGFFFGRSQYLWPGLNGDSGRRVATEMKLSEPPRLTSGSRVFLVGGPSDQQTKKPPIKCWKSEEFSCCGGPGRAGLAR